MMIRLKLNNYWQGIGLRLDRYQTKNHIQNVECQMNTLLEEYAWLKLRLENINRQLDDRAKQRGKQN